MAFPCMRCPITFNGGWPFFAIAPEYVIFTVTVLTSCVTRERASTLFTRHPHFSVRKNTKSCSYKIFRSKNKIHFLTFSFIGLSSFIFWFFLNKKNGLADNFRLTEDMDDSAGKVYRYTYSPSKQHFTILFIYSEQNVQPSFSTPC